MTVHKRHIHSLLVYKTFPLAILSHQLYTWDESQAPSTWWPGNEADNTHTYVCILLSTRAIPSRRPFKHSETQLLRLLLAITTGYH